MLQSIDGKVTGDFLSSFESDMAEEVYYELNRRQKCHGFICGRITMEGSFTKGKAPALKDLSPEESLEDFIPQDLSGFYAVAIDPKGKLGWSAPFIEDEDEGYNNAQVVEVLTEETDRRYLTYLKSLNIPYIIAGKEEIDVTLALEKLYAKLNCEKLLLEGGAVTNGSFLRADAVDELSLVISPTLSDADALPLFDKGVPADFELINMQLFGDGVIFVNYGIKV